MTSQQFLVVKHLGRGRDGVGLVDSPKGNTVELVRAGDKEESALQLLRTANEIQRKMLFRALYTKLFTCLRNTTRLPMNRPVKMIKTVPGVMLALSLATLFTLLRLRQMGAHSQTDITRYFQLDSHRYLSKGLGISSAG